MARKHLRQLIPSPARLRAGRTLHFLGEWIYHPSLWHLTRYSASMAFFIGLFIAFLPIPGHMPLAALTALLLRCNLPLAVVLTWVSNPFTLGPIFLLAYQAGAFVLGTPPGTFKFEMSWEWLQVTLPSVWQPFLLGCFLLGLCAGSIGYVFINLLWRYEVGKRWRLRRAARRARRSDRD